MGAIGGTEASGPEGGGPRKRRLPEVDLLPGSTSDDRPDATEAADRFDDDHYLRERPPHHG